MRSVQFIVSITPIAVCHVILLSGRGICSKGMMSTKRNKLNQQDRVSGYRNSPVDSEKAQRNSTSDSDPNIENVLKGVDDDDDWAIDGANSKKSAQHVVVKRKLHDLQYKCRIMKQEVPINVSGSVEQAKEQSHSSDVLQDDAQAK